MTKKQELIIEICKAVCGESAPKFAIEMAISCCERVLNALETKDMMTVDEIYHIMLEWERADDVDDRNTILKIQKVLEK